MINQTKTNERNIKDKKFHFWQYFQQHKGIVALMLFLQFLLLVSAVFQTIYFANIIETITEKAYFLAMRKLLIYLIESLARLAINLIYNTVWHKFRVLVSKEMGVDIIQQSFVVASKSYANHSSANFTQRIDNDPLIIFNSFNNRNVS